GFRVRQAAGMTIAGAGSETPHQPRQLAATMPMAITTPRAPGTRHQPRAAGLPAIMTATTSGSPERRTAIMTNGATGFPSARTERQAAAMTARTAGYRPLRQAITMTM